MEVSHLQRLAIEVFKFLKSRLHARKGSHFARRKNDIVVNRKKLQRLVKRD